jgi:hypothetical protein
LALSFQVQQNLRAGKKKKQDDLNEVTKAAKKRRELATAFAVHKLAGAWAWHGS